MAVRVPEIGWCNGIVVGVRVAGRRAPVPGRKALERYSKKKSWSTKVGVRVPWRVLECQGGGFDH